MDKKVLIGLIVGIVVLVIAGLLIFIGGNKGGVNLELDFSHMNDLIYKVDFSTAKGDQVTEFDKEEPNFVRIENELSNYVLDITLNTEAKDAYEQFKTSAKENELYEDIKFGKYDGYYSDDDGDIYGYILLDESDETFNVFVEFCVYLLDEDSEENNDIKTIFESSNVQNVLNNIKFKSSKK